MEFLVLMKSQITMLLQVSWLMFYFDKIILFLFYSWLIRASDVSNNGMITNPDGIHFGRSHQHSLMLIWNYDIIIILLGCCSAPEAIISSLNYLNITLSATVKEKKYGDGMEWGLGLGGWGWREGWGDGVLWVIVVSDSTPA